MMNDDERSSVVWHFNAYNRTMEDLCFMGTEVVKIPQHGCDQEKKLLQRKCFGVIFWALLYHMALMKIILCPVFCNVIFAIHVLVRFVFGFKLLLMWDTSHIIGYTRI